MSKQSRREARHKAETRAIQSLVRFNEQRGMPAAVTLDLYSAHKSQPPAFVVAPKLYVEHLIERLLKLIGPLTLILLLAISGYGQNRPEIKEPSPYDWHFIESSSVFWAGATTDWAASRNVYERNSFLRTSSGGLNNKVFWTMNLVGYFATVALQKKHPKAMNWLRRGMGCFHFGIAAHNARLTKLPEAMR